RGHVPLDGAADDGGAGARHDQVALDHCTVVQVRRAVDPHRAAHRAAEHVGARPGGGQRTGDDVATAVVGDEGAADVYVAVDHARVGGDVAGGDDIARHDDAAGVVLLAHRHVRGRVAVEQAQRDAVVDDGVARPAEIDDAVPAGRLVASPAVDRN